MSRVWDLECENHTQKLVLLALADNANDQGFCWPSLNHIAHKCNLSQEAVRLHVKRLSDRDWLKVDSGKSGTNGAPNISNRYTITLPPSQCRGEGLPNAVGKATQPGGEALPNAVGTNHHTEPSENQIERVRAPAGTSGRKPRSIEEALALGANIGVLEQDIRDWYRDSEACDWKRGDGTPFDNWVKQLCVHRDKLAERRARAPNYSGSSQKRELSILDLKSVIQVKEERARAIKEKFSTDGPLATDWRDAGKRREFFTLHKEIKELKARMERMV